MAFIVADRVQETATANTTVSFTLTGAIASYQSFSAIGNTNTTYYGATDGTNWEVGLGTYSTTGPTLTRTTILSSSNSGSAVTFSGAVTVWCDYPAGKQISSDYPNALGVVTPAAGTFTTITGQTEVLKGTGQNLLLQSQTFTSASWSKSNTTVTGSATTAPDSTNTASKIVASVTNAQHGVNQGVTLTTALCTFSFYAKASEYTNIRIDISDGATGDVYCDANLSAGTIGSVTSGGSWTNSSATITSAGNGWYRITLTSLRGAGSNPTPVIYLLNNAGSNSFAGNGTDGVFVWGAQIELGSTANTYIPTTTTAIYGTPTLSFSGVAGLGLQSDGSLYVSPAGTGALQAQATTSTATGGNARGANAVDWQTTRGSASAVASGTATVVGGGYSNIANAQYSVVAGGFGNNATGSFSFIGAGSSNTTSGPYGYIVGGNANTSAGYYNFVGGGYTNSGTANAAVTTQSGTMNATTAVTLSGSNANIKVGQYITGTSIAGDTYVAAISGTALTLSKVASGSSTSTLSFFTPHGVVVGGGNNQASGSYSFIGGGGDGGTAANRNVASGDWSVVAGGKKNTASGQSSFVGAGGDYISGVAGNTASGLASAVVAGFANSNSSYTGFLGAGSSNTLSAVDYAVLVGGNNQTVNGGYSAILGGQFGTTRSIFGNHVFPACNSPITGATGVSQAGLLVLGVQTTDATATVLRSNSSAASGTNQVILPNNSAYYFTGEVISGVTGGGDSKGWEIAGVIKRGANAASTTLVGSTVTSLYADAGAATWTIGLTADTTNGGLKVTFTGQASTTIRTVCQIRTTEMTY